MWRREEESEGTEPKQGHWSVKERSLQVVDQYFSNVHMCINYLGVLLMYRVYFSV